MTLLKQSCGSNMIVEIVVRVRLQTVVISFIGSVCCVFLHIGTGMVVLVAVSTGNAASQ